jgi:hypothetical protein
MSAEQEIYNYENDIFAVHDMKRDYGKMFKDNTTLSKEDAHYVKFAKRRWELSSCKQIQEGLGVKRPFFWLSTMGFVYLGGLFSARKQFINGGDYFLNQKFDFIGARRPLFFGLLVGMGVGSVIVGSPQKLNDEFRSFAKSWLVSKNIVERKVIVIDGITADHKSDYSIFDK